MFDKTRIITTIVLLSAIVCVVTCGILGGVLETTDENGDTSVNPIFTILVLVGIVVEYCAYFWYSLSYIPYGRKIFCKCFKKGTETI